MGTVEPTITEVLTEYLAAEKERLSPRTFSDYADVIDLLTHSLNDYGPNRLDKPDYTLWEKSFNAKGDDHKEFCDLFGPGHILPHLDEFLGYFMVRKVMAGRDFLRASGTVTKKLAKWLLQHGYVSSEEADSAIDRGAEAARDLPRAETLAARLYDFTTTSLTESRNSTF